MLTNETVLIRCSDAMITELMDLLNLLHISVHIQLNVSVIPKDKRVSMYRWRGCEVEIRGVRPTHCTPFTTNVRAEEFDHSIEETFRNFRQNNTDISGM